MEGMLDAWAVPPRWPEPKGGLQPTGPESERLRLGNSGPTAHVGVFFFSFHISLVYSDKMGFPRESEAIVVKMSSNRTNFHKNEGV